MLKISLEILLHFQITKMNEAGQSIYLKNYTSKLFEKTNTSHF